MLTRRFLLGSAMVGLGAAAFSARAEAANTFEVNYSKSEWRKRLSADRYTILRESGTERPYTSALLKEHRAGTFTCGGCDLPAFSSETKYDSNTGWPSFWAPLDNAVLTEADTSFGMTRSAVECRRCGGHLGHVFEDGPKPTGLRYCMNGLALGFKPAAA